MSVNLFLEEGEKKVSEGCLQKEEGVLNGESVKKSNDVSDKKPSTKKQLSTRRKRILYPSQAGKLETELVIVWEQESVGRFMQKVSNKIFVESKSGCKISGLESYQPPKGYVWISEWELWIDKERTDEGGWHYSSSFLAKDENWRTTRSLMRTCRRRRWSRCQARVRNSYLPTPSPMSLSELGKMLTTETEENHQEQKHITVFERMELVQGRWTSPVGRSRFSMDNKPVKDLNKIPYPKEDQHGSWSWACCWKIIRSSYSDSLGWVRGDHWHFPDGEVNTRVRLWRRIAIYVRSYKKPKQDYKHNLERIDGVIRRIVTQLFWYALLNSDNAAKAGINIYPDQDGFDDRPYILGGDSSEDENKEDALAPEEDLKNFNYCIIEFQIRMKCISLRVDDQYKKVEDILREEKISLQPDIDEEQKMIVLLSECLNLLQDCIVKCAMHEDEDALDWNERNEMLEKLSKVCGLYAAIKESDIVCMRTMGFYLVHTLLDTIKAVTGDMEDEGAGLFVFQVFREGAVKARAARKKEFQESAIFSIDVLTEMQDILKIIESSVNKEHELTEFTHGLKKKMEESTKLLRSHLGDYHDEDPDIVHDTFNIYARMRRIYGYEAKNYWKEESIKFIQSCMEKSADVLFQRLWKGTGFSKDLVEDDIGSDQFKEKWASFENNMLTYIKADLLLCDRLRKSKVVDKLSQYASMYLVTRYMSIILSKIHENEKAQKSIENKYGLLLLSGFKLQSEIGKLLLELEPGVPTNDHEIIQLVSKVLDTEAEVRFLGWIVESGDGKASLIPTIVSAANWKAGLGEDYKTEDEDMKYSQVVVDVFTILNVFLKSFFNFLKIFPDSASKQGKVFFQDHLLRLVNHFLIEVKHSVEIAAEKFQSAGSEAKPLKSTPDASEIEENIYLMHIQVLCVQFSTLTRVSWYVERWKKEFKTLMVGSVKEQKYIELLKGYAETFFHDASMMLETFTKKTSEFIVRHVVSLQVQKIWQDSLWLQPVEKHILNAEFFEMLKGYMEILDDSLSEKNFQIILGALMKEINQAATFLLTDDRSRDLGRFYQQKDGDLIVKDMTMLNNFFKAWDYKGPEPGAKGHPFESFHGIAHSMTKSTAYIIDEIVSSSITEISLSGMAKIDMTKNYLQLQVLWFRKNDKDAQDYVKELRPEPVRRRTEAASKPNSPIISSIPVARNSLKTGKNPMSLKVTVLSGKKLPACDRRGRSDPYVIIELFDKKQNPIAKRQKTKFLKKTLNPMWNEEKFFTLPPGYFLLHSNLSIKFTCMDMNRIGSDTMIGQAYTLFAQQQGSSRSLDLTLNEEPRGTLQVRFDLFETK